MAAPLNITLLAKKGGVGKSTTSILLYEVLRQAGKRCAQGLGCSGHQQQGSGVDSRQKPETVINPDIVIYDTPPNLDHTATATAVRSADLAFVMATPAPADIWEAEEAVQFVKERNPKANVRVVFNKVRKTTVLGRLVEESAKQVSAPTAGNAQRAGMLPARDRPGLESARYAAREETLQFALALLR